MIFAQLGENGNCIESMTVLFRIKLTESVLKGMKALEETVVYLLPALGLRLSLFVQESFPCCRNSRFGSLAVAVVHFSSLILSQMLGKVEFKYLLVFDSSSPWPSHPHNVTSLDGDRNFVFVGGSIGLVGEVRSVEWSFFLDWQVRAIHSNEDVVSLRAVLKAVLKEDLGKMVSGYAARAIKIRQPKFNSPQCP